METLEFYEYGERYKYPGMAPLDTAIWERYMKEYPAAFDRCAYNVAVGAGTEMNTVVALESGGYVNRLYQRKIDVVANWGGGYTIIELKPRASTAAIGQVKAYAKLFARDFGIRDVIKTLIITDELLPEMQDLATSEGVEIVVV